MEGRRSARLANKREELDGGANQPKSRRKPKGNTRDSVGGALGLTPHKPKDRNLQVAKTADAAEAAAARLDGFVAAEQPKRKKCKNKKARKSQRIDRTRVSYAF